MVPLAFQIAYNKVDYVDFGNYLTVDQIKREPTLVRWPRSPELLYTLMLISELFLCKYECISIHLIIHPYMHMIITWE